MDLTATYDSHDLVIEYTARGEATDYGVRDSGFVDVVDIALHTVCIAGVDVEPSELPKALVGALIDLANEVDFEGA